MGKTISEKIVAKAAGKNEVSAGDTVHVSAPYASIGADLDWYGRARMLERLGLNKPFDPKRIVLTVDHCGNAGGIQSSENVAMMRKWAKEVGVPRENIYDLGEQGNPHQLAVDHGFALPGDIYFAQDGHTTMLGAMGAYAVNLSYEMSAYMIRGWTWETVPETVKMNITGRLSEGVMGRDVIEHILSKIGLDGSLYQAMELTGPCIDDMSIDGRLSISCLVLFAGAVTGIINPDQKTIDYVKSVTDRPFKPLRSDPDAIYAMTYNFDVSDLEPQVVVPPYRSTAKPIDEVEGKKIDKAFIGSCASGRMEDLRIAAKILEGKDIHPDVMLNVTPGSVTVLKQAIREGVLETLIDAKAMIVTPCCGMCGAGNGHTALVGAETCITSNTTNYPGRIGSYDAQIYLGSPATVAASSIEGKITDPRKYL